MNPTNPLSSRLRRSRQHLVTGRWVWILAIVAAAAAVSLCAAQARAFCRSCNASADMDCASRGLVVCEYDCQAGICGGVNTSCHWECCTPPTGD